MILEVCSGLVTIDGERNVRLVHLTVQEYLQRKSIIHQDLGLMKITITCFL
jgi:hypothetical protein